MTHINVKCQQSAKVLRWVRAAITAFFVIFIIYLLSGCADTRTVVNAKSVTITETAPRIVVKIDGMPLPLSLP